MADYYSLLQVSPDASQAAIHSAYRKLVKTCHPDLHPGNAALTQKFVKLSEAYETLSDTNARNDYDKSRMKPEASQSYSAAPAAATHQSAEERAADIYDLFMARNRHGGRKSDFDISYMLLTILQSPLTYCILIMFMLLCLIKGLSSGAISTHHYAHVITATR